MAGKLRCFPIYVYRLKNLFKAEGKEWKKVARYDLGVEATGGIAQRMSI